MKKIKSCVICKEDFVYKNINKDTCGVRCAQTWYRIRKREGTTRKYNQHQIKVKRTPTTRVDIKLVEDFIYRMKYQRFMADYIDILRLVDIFDLLFPTTKQLPKMNDVETSCNIMFTKICLWYKHHK